MGKVYVSSHLLNLFSSLIQKVEIDLFPLLSSREISLKEPTFEQLPLNCTLNTSLVLYIKTEINKLTLNYTWLSF